MSDFKLFDGKVNSINFDNVTHTERADDGNGAFDVTFHFVSGTSKVQKMSSASYSTLFNMNNNT